MSVDERTRTAAPAAQGASTDPLTPQSPWPGLFSFTERDAAFFFGRDGDIERLLAGVQRSRLVVLFSRSGLGKTSLLRAGLFPRLRGVDFVPVYLRLDHDAADARTPTPVDQVFRAIADQVAAGELAAPERVDDEPLWSYFHRRGAQFWNRGNDLVEPVLVFDQFEEIFTRGRETPASIERGDAFFRQLADLVENQTPAAVRERLAANPGEVADFTFDQAPVRVVLSLREDFLPQLERRRTDMPQLMRERIEIRAMSGVDALTVVTGAGREIIAPADAEQIVRFIAASQRRGSSPDAPLAELAVEPALLSLMCAELNRERLAMSPPPTHITAAQIKGAREDILERFYDRCFKDIPDAGAVRAYLEENLLTASGFRNSVAQDDAEQRGGLSPATIDTLIHRRLLRRDEREGATRLELTHDVLCSTVRRSRDDRAARERVLAAERAAQQRVRDAERAQWTVARRVGGVVLVVVAGLLAWVWYLRSENAAQLQRNIDQARQEARLKFERDKFEQQVRMYEQLLRFSEFGDLLERWPTRPSPVAAIVPEAPWASHDDEFMAFLTPPPVVELEYEQWLPAATLRDAAFAPDGCGLALLTDAGDLHVHDLRTGGVSEPLAVDVRAFAFVPGPGGCDELAWVDDRGTQCGDCRVAFQPTAAAANADAPSSMPVLDGALLAHDSRRGQLVLVLPQIGMFALGLGGATMSPDAAWQPLARWPSLPDLEPNQPVDAWLNLAGDAPRAFLAGVASPTGLASDSSGRSTAPELSAWRWTGGATDAMGGARAPAVDGRPDAPGAWSAEMPADLASIPGIVAQRRATFKVIRELAATAEEGPLETITSTDRRLSATVNAAAMEGTHGSTEVLIDQIPHLNGTMAADASAPVQCVAQPGQFAWFAFSPDSLRLCVASHANGPNDRTGVLVRVWRVRETGAGALPLQRTWVSSLAIDPANNRIVSAGDSDGLTQLSPDSLRPMSRPGGDLSSLVSALEHRVRPLREGAIRVAFSPDGRRIAILGVPAADGSGVDAGSASVTIVDTARGSRRTLGSLRIPVPRGAIDSNDVSEAIGAMAFGDDGDRLAVSWPGDPKLHIVSVADDTVLATVDVPPGETWIPLLFSSDGGALLVGRDTELLIVDNMEGGRARVRLLVSRSPFGRLIQAVRLRGGTRVLVEAPEFRRSKLTAMHDAAASRAPIDRPALGFEDGTDSGAMLARPGSVSNRIQPEDPASAARRAVGVATDHLFSTLDRFLDQWLDRVDEQTTPWEAWRTWYRECASGPIDALDEANGLPADLPAGSVAASLRAAFDGAAAAPGPPIDVEMLLEPARVALALAPSEPGAGHRDQAARAGEWLLDRIENLADLEDADRLLPQSLVLRHLSGHDHFAPELRVRCAALSAGLVQEWADTRDNPRSTVTKERTEHAIQHARTLAELLLKEPGVDRAKVVQALVDHDVIDQATAAALDPAAGIRAVAALLSRDDGGGGNRAERLLDMLLASPERMTDSQRIRCHLDRAGIRATRGDTAGSGGDLTIASALAPSLPLAARLGVFLELARRWTSVADDRRFALAARELAAGQAIAAFDECMRLDPARSVRIAGFVAPLLVRRGEVATLIDVLSRLDAVAQQSPSVDATLAIVRGLTGVRTLARAALPTLDRIIDRTTADAGSDFVLARALARAWTNRGRLHAQDGHADAAIGALTASMDGGDDDHLARCVRAVVHLWYGWLEHARDDAQSAIADADDLDEVGDRAVWPRILLAGSRVQRGMPLDDTWELLDQAAAIAAASPEEASTVADAHLALARLCGDTEREARVLGSMVEERGSDTLPLARHAEFLLRTGDRAGAAAAGRQALAEAADHASQWRAVVEAASLLALLTDGDERRAHFEHAGEALLDAFRRAGPSPDRSGIAAELLVRRASAAPPDEAETLMALALMHLADRQRYLGDERQLVAGAYGLRNDPIFAGLRDDPDFPELVAAISHPPDDAERWRLLARFYAGVAMRLTGGNVPDQLDSRLRRTMVDANEPAADPTYLRHVDPAEDARLGAIDALRHAIDRGLSQERITIDPILAGIVLEPADRR